MRISQLAELTGFSAPAIRYYENVGLLPAARRTAGGYRDYGPEHQHYLRYISKAKSLGLSLDAIAATLTNAEAHRCDAVRALLITKLNQLQDDIDTLVHQRSLLERRLRETEGTDQEAANPTRLGCWIIDELELEELAAIAVAGEVSENAGPRQRNLND